MKNESGTHEFPCFSVEATPYWGKGQQVKIYIYTYIHTCIIYILYIFIHMQYINSVVKLMDDQVKSPSIDACP